jgi:hypothetical protein
MSSSVGAFGEEPTIVRWGKSIVDIGSEYLQLRNFANRWCFSIQMAASAIVDHVVKSCQIGRTWHKLSANDERGSTG